MSPETVSREATTAETVAPGTIVFDPRGPAGGLEDWGPVAPAELTAGEGRQRGFEYFRDPSGRLTAGVWACTPMTTRLSPYSVDEFMQVLEGSVTIIDASGHEETIRAGDCFVIPRGMPCVWRQEEPIRKFYVILDDPARAPAAEPKALRVIRPRAAGPEGGLAPMDVGDRSVFVGAVPRQGVHSYYEDTSGQFSVGVWETTAMEKRPVVFPRNELMHILEGEVTITDATGARTFRRGDTFLVPRGATYGWQSKGAVRKFYCIFRPAEA